MVSPVVCPGFGIWLYVLSWLNSDKEGESSATVVTLVYPGKAGHGFSVWTLGCGARRKTGENAEKLHAACLS